ncbi:MAG: ribosome silencing factor [bacterium]
MISKDSSSYTLAKQIISFAQDKKAHNIVLLKVGELSSVADYFIICHGEADVHVKAIADNILENTSSQGINIWHFEGYEYYHWVILDYINVVVHIFLEDYRNYYNLERLWGDAHKETFS